jgi:hypothetical protein
MKQSRSSNTSPLKRRNIGTRALELGYYLIVTDTRETERNYLIGLKESLGSFSDHIVIRVIRAATKNLVETCLREINLDPKHRMGWIVFDRDEVVNFDSIITEAEKSNIRVDWSNPCIEIWFHAYFGNMPSCIDSVQCCHNFGKEYFHRTRRKYNKVDIDIYDVLKKNGDENNAIRLAMNKNVSFQGEGMNPSGRLSSTTLYMLIEEIIKNSMILKLQGKERTTMNDNGRIDTNEHERKGIGLRP